jgi:RNA polymerase sigma-54 factor
MMMRVAGPAFGRRCGASFYAAGRAGQARESAGGGEPEPGERNASNLCAELGLVTDKVESTIKTMSQGLHLQQRLTMAQVLAPQLQQSLAVLQVATLELKALVDQEIQQNPVLEEVPEAEEAQETREEDTTASESNDPTEPPEDVQFDPATPSSEQEPVDDFQAEFEKLAQLDQDWRDHFSQTNLPSRQSPEEEERREFLMNSIVAETSLQEYLLDQMRLSELPENLAPIGEMIIGNIDDYGYLQLKPEDLALTTGVPVEDIRKVLAVVHSFHPPGVGARDLRECLMIQMERADHIHTLEYRIVRDHMEALGKRRIPEIARATGLTVEQVQQAIERISRLDPKPGRSFLPANHQYVVPEVFVQRNGEDYVVTINDEQVPRLRISNTYKDIMSNPGSSNEVRDYIRDKIRAGKFLIKSIHQRHQTILNIANEIVKRQRDFFDRGITHLKPLTMGQVAEVVGVHETTVSRAVSGKYMQTPHGVFDMKFFFSSGFTTTDGSNLSNTSIKEMISEVVRNEPPSAPYSDDQIVKLMAGKNIKLARRTVAKYRSELNILPSNLRRVY